MQDKFNVMSEKLKKEKENIEKVHSLKEQISEVNAQIEKAQREYDLNKAAELKYSKLITLQNQLSEAEKQVDNVKNGLLQNKVTEEGIRQVVSNQFARKRKGKDIKIARYFARKSCWTR